MRVLQLFGILLTTLLLSACAATQSLSEPDRARAKTVTVSSKVEVGQLFLLAPGGANTVAMMKAASFVSSDSRNTDPASFGKLTESHGISIDTIVREEFEKVLRESGKLTVASVGAAGVPSLRIAVPQYGFGVRHMLSTNVVAVMQLQCTLTDSSGKVMWSENERIFPSIASSMDIMQWSNLIDNPALIEEQYRKAARYLAKIMVARL
jgi:hypothetical protein